MKTETIYEHAGHSRVRITLGDETHEAAGTSKKVWAGPGSFIRETWPDGARDDYQETAKLTFRPPLPYYTLSAEDVGKAFIFAWGKPWRCSDFIGRVMDQDIGKRCYLVGEIVQVENDEQRTRRLSRG